MADHFDKPQYCIEKISFDAKMDPENPIHDPITYEDLLRIGKDCVKVFKHKRVVNTNTRSNLLT